eukprot:EC816212.1.p1 GENE.EC816212.1~~EC816212.1.p1  ORF type:complete len:229 (-),score=70.28 EC816212.1:10-696(-)
MHAHTPNTHTHRAAPLRCQCAARHTRPRTLCHRRNEGRRGGARRASRRRRHAQRMQAEAGGRIEANLSASRRGTLRAGRAGRLVREARGVLVGRGVGLELLLALLGLRHLLGLGSAQLRLGGDRAALLDHGKRGTDDIAASASDALRAGLLDLLGGALLVHAAVHHSPVDLARVHLLVEERVGLAAQERVHQLGRLHVGGRHIAETVARIDLDSAERAELSLDRHFYT